MSNDGGEAVAARVSREPTQVAVNRVKRSMILPLFTSESNNHL